MNVSIFQDWFRKFCDLVTDRPLIVILDGHISHLDKGTIELAIQQNITLIKLPPHTTDILQPLDKCCFGPLKLKWNNTLIEWQRLNQRKLSKNEFSDLICKIWHEGLSEEVIKSSFQKTGIYPPNRNLYPVHRLNPQKLQRYREHNVVEDVLDPFEASEIQVNIEEPMSNLETDTSSTPLRESTNTSSKGEAEKLSFETLLLSKIQRTIPPSIQRRKIDASAKVLTSAEFLEEIKRKETKEKRKPSKKCKEISSSSEEEGQEQTTVIYEDESDLEGITLEDLINEDNKSTDSDNCEMDSQEGFFSGDYILVRFASKTNVVYFVAHIDEVKEDEVDATYLKRQGNIFIYSKLVEKYVVMKSDI